MVPSPYPSDSAGLRESPGELADAERWAEHVEAARHSGEYVSHEPLDGPMFIVTTRSSDAMHHVVGISSGRSPHREGCASEPDETVCAVLRSVVRAVLDLAGYESGSARAEVVLTSQGPRIGALRLDTATHRVDE